MSSLWLELCLRGSILCRLSGVGTPTDAASSAAASALRPVAMTMAMTTRSAATRAPAAMFMLSCCAAAGDIAAVYLDVRCR